MIAEIPNMPSLTINTSGAPTSDLNAPNVHPLLSVPCTMPQALQLRQALARDGIRLMPG